MVANPAAPESESRLAALALRARRLVHPWNGRSSLRRSASTTSMRSRPMAACAGC